MAQTRDPITGALFDDGAQHTAVKSVPDIETNTSFIEVNGSGTNDLDVLYTSPEGMYGYNCLDFNQTIGINSPALKVQILLNQNDTTWKNVSFHDLTTGTAYQKTTTTAGAAKSYRAMGRYYQIRIIQSGADATNVVGAHSNGSYY